MNERPVDGGPIYAETDLSGFIAEPWNALSSLAIVLPAIYWAIKLKGQVRTYTFIYYCVPLLFLGGTGSTLFHAFRAHRGFLMMDWMPTAILMLSVSIYFWYKVLNQVWHVPIVIIGSFVLRIGFFALFPNLRTINANYFFTGVMIFLPVGIYLVTTGFKNYRDILISVCFLLLALLCRELDHSVTEWLYMGSHFLWHVFSGIGAFYLANYLFKLRVSENHQISS